MCGIQPAGLTDAELLHYCWLTGYDKLEPAWVEELAKRLKHMRERVEEHLDLEGFEHPLMT